MDFLVTGGAGFIGSHVTQALVERGSSVRVLDNLSTGRLSNLDGLTGRIDWRQGDIRDRAAVAQAMDGVRCVLHLAALPSVGRSVKDPVSSNDNNVTGTLNLLVAARDAGVERFVFSSSSSVYGNTPVLPKKEDMPPKPLSPYAAQKLMGEHYIRLFHSLYGMKTFALRYFNVYGPRQDPDGPYAAAIPRFIGLLKEGKPPVVYGDGNQTRDFTFVRDVVAANLACSTAKDEAAGQVMNIAGGGRVSILDLIAALQRIMGTRISPRMEPERRAEVRDSQGDVTLAGRLIGWKPGTTLEKGLAETVRFFAPGSVS